MKVLICFGLLQAEKWERRSIRARRRVDQGGRGRRRTREMAEEQQYQQEREEEEEENCGAQSLPHHVSHRD